MQKQGVFILSHIQSIRRSHWSYHPNASRPWPLLITSTDTTLVESSSSLASHNEQVSLLPPMTLHKNLNTANRVSFYVFLGIHPFLSKLSPCIGIQLFTVYIIGISLRLVEMFPPSFLILAISVFFLFILVNLTKGLLINLFKESAFVSINFLYCFSIVYFLIFSIIFFLLLLWV